MMFNKFCRIVCKPIRRGITVLRENIFDPDNEEKEAHLKDLFDYDPESTLDGEPNSSATDPADQLGDLRFQVQIQAGDLL
jgi:hypothetical protein